MGLLSAESPPVTHYLANKPDGVVLAYLIVAAVMFLVSAYLGRSEGLEGLYRTTFAIGLLALTLALLKPF